MVVRVTAVVSREPDSPESLRSAARRFGDRRLLRFLDLTSLSPFLALLEAYGENPVCSPDRVALFTVSGWDPGVPRPPFEVHDAPEMQLRLSAHYLESANPTGWLHMMSNAALCQAAIAGGLRGPNAHYVGGAEALRQALVVALRTLQEESAGLAILCAYDPPPGHETARPDAVASRAVAIGLAAGDEGGPGTLSSDVALTRAAEAAVRDGRRAVDAAGEYVAVLACERAGPGMTVG
jgi:hypothetical protein